MIELQLSQADLAGIAGSGTAGRVTIKDLENFLGGLEGQPAEKPSAIRTGVADAMRRVRWRRWAFQFASTRFWKTAPNAIRNPARRCTFCAPSPLPSRNNLTRRRA